MCIAPPITLADHDAKRLRELAADDTNPRLQRRCKALLLAAAGHPSNKIAERLGVSPHSVARWRKAYAEDGLDGVREDAPRPGRPPAVTNRVQAVVLQLAQERSPYGAGWSTRLMGAHVGASRETIRRLFKTNDLAPHFERDESKHRIRLRYQKTKQVT